MNERETVELLADLITRWQPFVHVRFGDGDVMFATGTGSKVTGDGETWTAELGGRLRSAWHTLALHPGRLLVGDVETYAVSDGCEKEWLDLVQEAEEIRKQPLEFVHMEALRVSFGQALPFYQAAARDDRPKVFVGPERLHGAATLLGASHHVPVPLHVAHAHAEEIFEQVSAGIGEHGWQVAYFAAGRGGKLIQAALSASRPGLTQVDVGSGLDVLFTDLRRGTDHNVNRGRLRFDYGRAGLRVDG